MTNLPNNPVDPKGQLEELKHILLEFDEERATCPQGFSDCSEVDTALEKLNQVIRAEVKKDRVETLNRCAKLIENEPLIADSLIKQAAAELYADLHPLEKHE